MLHSFAEQLAIWNDMFVEQVLKFEDEVYM